MEQKTSKSNNFMPLLFNILKNKKSWFFISSIIILVTTVIIPYIVKSYDTFVVLGILESFLIVFLNCMIDNNFLHSDSKLAYYKSKPVSFEKQILLNIISNIILACFLMVMIAISIVFSEVDYMFNEVFKFMVPWMAVGILVASLSSVLTGNTIVASIMTAFNFALPALIYLIMMFVFIILEDIVIGFGANILMDSVTYKVYRLDYLYFIRYLESNSIDIPYICILISLIAGLGILIKICVKRRKNENTGNFIVFDGYKYFVSVFASLIIPAIFAMSVYGVSIGNKIFVFVILAILSYYIIIAVLEKSFRISVLSVKLFTCFLIVFIMFTGGTISVANRFKTSVPDENNIKMAYIGDSTWVYSNIERTRKNVFEIKEDFSDKAKDVLIFTEKENIKTIIDIHKELLKSQDYGGDMYLGKVVISYMMDNGRAIVREYTIKRNVENSVDEGEAKDNIAKRLINSDEFKKHEFYYIYDKEFIETNVLYYNINRAGDGQPYTDNADYNEFKIAMEKDLNKIIAEDTNAFETILNKFYGQDKYRDDNKEISYYIDITQRNSQGYETYLSGIYIDDTFINILFTHCIFNIDVIARFINRCIAR